jgi:hypothetical protein
VGVVEDRRGHAAAKGAQQAVPAAGRHRDEIDSQAMRDLENRVHDRSPTREDRLATMGIDVAALAERDYVERLILRSRRPAGQRGWLPRQLARASNNCASRVTVAQFRIVQTTPSVESNQELVNFERATPLGRLR